ncbi:hypothetical protein [Acidianus sp. HS-5]|uniref:hypothetical protein n=1 Tax=Acidianus sp. HS-5 TaxID=2886040 RepID=UPI001F3DCDEE|nr:hypothetical protein [Acidianus sp. HS-5]BDC18801.1 hypothetical protein HS5_16910 [Acidianus sp. HS-5]
MYKIAIYGSLEIEKIPTFRINSIEDFDIGDVLVIHSNDIKVDNPESLEKFLVSLSQGKIVIWVGIPFHKVYVKDLYNARKVADILTRYIPKLIIDDVYVGYESNKGYFVNLEYKKPKSIVTCEEISTSNLAGIVQGNRAEDPIPLSSEIIPYNICRSNDGLFTTSYSIIIGKGQILRPYSRLEDNEFFLQELIIRIAEINKTSRVRVSSNINDYSIHLAKAYALYEMGFAGSAAVELRKLAESVSKDILTLCCSGLGNLGNSRLRKTCKMLESGKTNVAGEFADILSNPENVISLLMNTNDFVPSLEECRTTLERLNTNRNKVELIRNYIELAKNTGNLGAHTEDLTPGDVEPSLITMQKLLTILEEINTPKADTK